MGFHVECPGAELLRRLRADASAFLGEPYSLYFLALATQLDDEALAWLHKYEMQLDSLCGPYAAFLLFYNQARLLAEPYPRPWTAPSTHAQDSVVEIAVKPNVLNGGFDSVDDVLRFDPRAHTHRDILVTSMTYESDAVARELGVVGRLPCLVVFDDPSSDVFYVLSLSNADEDTLRDLRALVSMFVADPAHADYLSTLAKWHTENATLEQLLARRRDLLARKPNDPDYIYAVLRQARQLLLAGRVKEFRATVNLMESQSGNVGRLPWKEIRRASNDVSAALSLSRKLLATETSDDHRAAALERAGQLTDLPINADVATAVRALEDSVIRTTDAAIKLILDSLALGDSEGLLPDPIRRIEEQISAQEKILQRFSELLTSTPRPSLSRHVSALQKEERNRMIIHKTGRVLTEASGRLPPILEAVRKGLELFS